MFPVVYLKMEHKKKICIVTGSRAEYGLLKLIMQEISDSKDLTLQLIVTGSHLSQDLGKTIKQIETDGFKADYKVNILEKDDSPRSISRSISKVLNKFPTCYDSLKPDMLLVLGDRYEIFAAVTAALIYKIPVAHIHGGEITEGAFDESLRHSITKMSSVHFTSCMEHKIRVEQLGENPKHVFNVGAPGVELIKSLKLLSKQSIQEIIGIPFQKNNYLVTFHPETLGKNTPEMQIDSLLRVLEETNASIIFTKSNSDPGGMIINKKIEEFVLKNLEKSILFSSLGQLNYLSTMKYATAVVGNSSSGLIEAPSLSVPVINIGDRQKGRLQSDNVINCGNNESQIKEAFGKLESLKIQNKKSLFDGGNTSKKIIKIIRKLNFDTLLQKSFHDIPTKS